MRQSTDGSVIAWTEPPFGETLYPGDDAPDYNPIYSCPRTAPVLPGVRRLRCLRAVHRPARLGPRSKPDRPVTSTERSQSRKTGSGEILDAGEKKLRFFQEQPFRGAVSPQVSAPWVSRRCARSRGRVA